MTSSSTVFEYNCSCWSPLCTRWIKTFTFFFFGASALPSKTAWCLRTPLALKMMSSLLPPSSVGVQVTVRLKAPSGCKHTAQGKKKYWPTAKSYKAFNEDKTSLVFCELCPVAGEVLARTTYLNCERVVVDRKAFIRWDLFNNNLRFCVLCGVFNPQNSRFWGSQLHCSKCYKRSLWKLDQTQNRNIIFLVCGVLS